MLCVSGALAGSGCRAIAVPEGGTGSAGMLTGGFVETMRFANGRTLNMQVTEEEVPVGEAGFPHVLTIGRFSPLIGSGFSARRNIYYQEQIGSRGSDTFKVEGEEYRVRWYSSNYMSVLDPERTIFDITIEEVLPAAQPSSETIRSSSP